MATLLERLNQALADRYSVESEIGRGGMATVFLAEDLRHRRKVAVKVLHPELASAVGHGRFLNEIEIVAGLEHPHILTLIDSGEADGLLFYVMPFIDGESLRQRLEKKGQLPVEEAVRISVEVADGLDYAHGKGIVHRDVKPGNILLSGKHAVITDFGIARAITVARDDRLTGTGLTLGTPLYASPEQAMGAETLDGRTDIYSLGCVLYEMLSGEIPLSGPTPVAMQQRRMSETPSPLHQIRGTVSPLLDQVIGKALATLPADRFDTAEEFGNALMVASMDATPVAQLDLASTPGLTALIRRGRMTRFLNIPLWLLILIPALVLGTAGVWGFVAWQAGLEGEGPGVPQAMAPERREIQLTDHGRVWQVSPAISPDGRHVVYSIADRPRDFSMQMARNFTQFLMMAEIGEGGLLDEPKLITQMQDCYRVLWSQDGRHLVVSGVIRESRGTFVVPVSGGRIRQISDRAYGVMDWAPDGSRLAVRSLRDVGFVDPSQSGTGEITGRFQLPTNYEGISSLAWSPTGDRIAVAADSSGVAVVWTVTPDGRDAERVASDLHVQDLSWVPSGDAIYYSRAPDRTLLRLGPIDDSQRPPVAEPLVQRCRWFSVSSDGRRLTCQRVAGLDQIWLRSLDPAADSVLLTPDTAETRGLPHLSPDGERIAYVEEGPEGHDLFVLSLIDGQRNRITRRGDVGGGNLVTAWSPDGQFLAFPASGPDGTMALWIVPSHGGPSVRVGGVEPALGLTWAPSQNLIVQTEGGSDYTVVMPPGGSWAEALSGQTVLNNLTTRSLLPLDTSTSSMSVALAVSPDGETAAVRAFFRGEEGIWLFTLDGETQQLLYPRTPEFGDLLVAGWTKEGEGVYLRDGASMYLVSLASRDIRQVDVPRRGICEPEELSVVNRFLCYDVAITADLWLIENFDPHAE